MKHLVDIKAKNKKNIIKVIHKNKKISKKKIASLLELSASVMTKLCNELKKEDLIVELNKAESTSVGRKETLMGINYEYKKIIGISINHMETTVVLSDLKPDILVTKIFKTDMNPVEYLKTLANMINEILNENNVENNEILGVGLSLKGATDGKHSISGIWGKRVEFRDYLESILGMPVILENGVRCSALLESFYSGIDDFLLIKYVKAGIGGAIMVGGELAYGDSYRVAEIGHIIIDPTREYCDVCKRKGCLESLISYEKILIEIKENFDRTSLPILYELCDGDFEKVTIETIFKAAEEGSIQLNKIIRRAASRFSIAIINAYSILDINKIVLVGAIFKERIFIGYLKSFIMEYQLEDFWERVKVSQIKESPLAAALLVVNKLLY